MNQQIKKNIEALKMMIRRVEKRLSDNTKLENDTLIMIDGKYICIFRNGNTITDLRPVDDPLKASWVPKGVAEQIAQHSHDTFKMNSSVIDWREALKEYIARVHAMIEVIEKQGEIIIQ